jgi:hypothetical protein
MVLHQLDQAAEVGFGGRAGVGGDDRLPREAERPQPLQQDPVTSTWVSSGRASSSRRAGASRRNGASIARKPRRSIVGEQLGVRLRGRVRAEDGLVVLAIRVPPIVDIDSGA